MTITLREAQQIQRKHRYVTVNHFSGFTFGIADLKSLTVIDASDDQLYIYETLEQLITAWSIDEDEVNRMNYEFALWTKETI